MENKGDHAAPVQLVLPCVLHECWRPLPPGARTGGAQGHTAGISGGRLPSSYTQSPAYVWTVHNLMVFPGYRERERNDMLNAEKSFGFCWPQGFLRHFIYSSVRLVSGPVSDAAPSSPLLLEQVFLMRKKKKPRLNPHYFIAFSL